MTNEARRRAEEIEYEFGDYRDAPGQLTQAILTLVDDAVAQAVKERDAEIKMLRGACQEKERVGDQLIVKSAQQAETIARLTEERNMLRDPARFTEALLADTVREKNEEIGRLTTRLRRCEGALADAGTVPTDDVEQGIRTLTAERDRLRAALRELVAAEDRYVRESGMPLDDPISAAVQAARAVLGAGAP